MRCSARAARVKETVTVDDVTADAEYIACSLETRSEIVVPIMRGDRFLGEIDIDSDVPAAFSIADRKFLEKVAQYVRKYLAKGHAVELWDQLRQLRPKGLNR